jgi:LysR family transcriptional regulator of abg operon
MTLSQLRVFCTVVEQGSVRAAARTLDIAQSALTHAIQSLEAELAVPLLIRSHFGISVTPFGAKLLIRATAILKDCERIDQDMRQLEGEPTGRIALGVTCEPLAELLPPVLKRFMSMFPRVLVHVSGGSSQMQIEKIRDGRLDFAVCPLAPQVVDADLNIVRLYRSTPAIIARAGHPKEHATSIAELADCEWVGIRSEGIVGGAANRLVSMFTAHGLGVPKIAITGETQFEELHLVCTTDYLAMAPRVVVDFPMFSNALVSIPIREAFNPRDVCLIRRSASPLTFIAQELSSMLMSYSRLQHGMGR